MRQVIRACTRVSLRAGTLVQPMPAVGQWRYDCTDRYEAARGAQAVDGRWRLSRLVPPCTTKAGAASEYRAESVLNKRRYSESWAPPLG